MIDNDAYELLIKPLHAMDVLDGAVVPSRYAAANPRCLWILREPDGEGPWDLREFLATDDKLFHHPTWAKTFGLVATVSYGLLNGSLPWESWADSSRTLTDALRQIAVININKRGGGSQVNWEVLGQASLSYDPIVTEQIRLLRPQVVILGGTIGIIPKSIRDRLASIEDSPMTAAVVDGCVWFNGYHPNQRTISWEAYYNKVRDEVIRATPSAPST
jgi:hypothetical protein